MVHEAAGCALGFYCPVRAHGRTTILGLGDPNTRGQVGIAWHGNGGLLGVRLGSTVQAACPPCPSDRSRLRQRQQDGLGERRDRHREHKGKAERDAAPS